MENRNLYKMDDFLIIISYLMIIPILVIAWPWLKSLTDFESIGAFFQSAPVLPGPRLSAIIMYGTGAVSSQIVGRVIRFKEKQSLEILDTLNFYKKTTVSQLSSQLNIAESKIISLVKKMTRIPSLGISIEGEIVTIGQKTETAMPDNFSSFTSANKESENTVSQEEVINPAGMDLKDIVKNTASRSDLTDEQKKEEFKKVAQNFLNIRQTPAAGGKKFNIILFIILFVTPLWPIALVYAITFVIKQKKALTDKQD